jgi:hypothetical protein
MLLMRIAGLAACAALGAALWNYWASICNEACGAGRSLSMMFLSVALPRCTGLLVFQATTESGPARVRTVAMVAWLGLSFWAAYVSLVR